jgi:hypothetical protein
MPKLLCKCSEVLRYGEIPCPIEWRLISDVDFERLSGQVDAEAVYQATQMMLRCPRCDRLWVFWDQNADPTEYIPGDAAN